MAETKPTPTPWRAEQRDDYTWTIGSEDYGTITTLHAAYGVEAQRETIELDALFIVRAVNAHAALVEALRQSEAALNIITESRGKNWTVGSEARRSASAALKLAEEADRP